MQKKSEPTRNLVWLTVNSSYSHSSLALPLIHARCCEIPGWHWEHCETTIAEDPLETVCRLEKSAPDLLCISLYLFNRKYVLDIVRRFHVLHPECPIVAGGPECLGEGAASLLTENPFLYAVFRGEGEQLFHDYLQDFENQSPHQILPAEGNAVFDDWESVSYPVNDPFFRNDKPFIQYETSRGCPMGCTYCTSGKTHYRFKNPDTVCEELTALRSAGVREIRLLDRTFNLPLARGAALLKLFREKFPEIHFHLEVHPQFLDENLKNEFRHALPGQLHIEAGIQSLSKDVQQAIGRKSDPADALSGLQFLCRCSAFETHVDLLAGLPEQSFEGLADDVSVLMRTAPAEIQLEVLKILPGTPLQQTAAAQHLRSNPFTPYDVMSNGCMSPDHILLARKLSRLLDLTYNHGSLHPVIVKMAEENTEALSLLLEYFLSKGLELNTLYDLKKRFLLLAEFFSSHSFPSAAAELAFQWICAGYPLDQTPCIQPEKIMFLPEQRHFLSGREESITERETKFWSLHSGRQFFYFAFNRKYSFNRPAAIWRNAE